MEKGEAERKFWMGTGSVVVGTGILAVGTWRE